MKFEDIAGHTTVKRALEVAVAGDHSILLVGPRGVGKETLLAALKALGFSIPARAVLACWCGADDLQHACACSERAKARYARRLRAMAADFDLLLEVCPVPVKEYGSGWGRGTSAEALERALPVRALQAQRKAGPMTDERGKQSLESLLKQLDDAGRRTFEMATRRLGLGCGDTEAVLRVARTIADLAGDKAIPARALAEAVQYRAPWFMRG